jgi:hypothetical protein
MARSRNIKHGFFLNDTLADIAPLGRLLFIGLWTIADYKGCLLHAHRKIKAQVLPYDDCNVEQLLTDLEKAGFIRSYSRDGRTYIKILGFNAHQNPHKNERDAGSEIPDMIEDGNCSVEKTNKINDLKTIGTKPDFIGSTRADSLPLIPDSLPLIPDSLPLIPDSLDAQSENQKIPAAIAADPVGFAKFWTAWPATDRKSGKAVCLKLWRDRKLEGKAAQIVENVELWKLTRQWIDGFEPSPTTWLRQSRYDDDPPKQAQAGAHALVVGKGAANPQSRLEQGNNDVLRSFLNKHEVIEHE